jgi:hypothetical protein
MPKPWPTHAVLWIDLVLLVIFLSACATSVQSTPLQEATWSAGTICNARYPLLQIERVEPDGRYWWRGRDGYTGSLQQFQSCVSTERNKVQYGKASPKELIRNAYLTDTTPSPAANTLLTAGPPPT